MEAQEREKVLEQLCTSESRLLTLVDGLTAEQWAFREEPGRWSIAEVMEHVIVVERAIHAVVGQALAGEKHPEKQERARSLEPIVFTIAEPMSPKLKAMETLLPRGRWQSHAEMLRAFQEVRAGSVTFVTATDAPLRDYFYPHQALGDLDCYQWLVILSLHGARHARQIEQIMKDPAYPTSTQHASITA